MTYLKPQSPIKYKEDYIYPLTTIDQVVMEDGQRLSGVGVYLDKPDEGEEHMAYIKPQYPLKNGDNYIYPPTTADQVILSDGSRLEKNGEIIADKLSDAKSISLTGGVTGTISFDGGSNVTMNTTVNKLSTARAISLTGDVTGSANFDGSAGISIKTTVSASKFYTATLKAASWSSSAPYRQTVTVSGIKSSDNPIVDINMSAATNSNSADLLGAWMLVGRVATADGKITAYCYEEKPTVDISVNLMVVK